MERLLNIFSSDENNEILCRWNDLLMVTPQNSAFNHILQLSGFFLPHSTASTIIHKVNGYPSCNFQMKKHILNSLVLCLQKVTQLMNSNHKDFLSFYLPFKLLTVLKHVLKLHPPRGDKCIFKMNPLTCLEIIVNL